MCTHVLMSVCILTEDKRSGSETKSVDYLRQKQKPEQSLASVLWVPIPTGRCEGQMVPTCSGVYQREHLTPARLENWFYLGPLVTCSPSPLGRGRTLTFTLEWKPVFLERGRLDSPGMAPGGKCSLSLFSGQEAVLSSDQERDSVFSCKGVLLCRHPWKDCQVLLPNSCSKVRYSWRIVFWERPPGIKWGA